MADELKIIKKVQIGEAAGNLYDIGAKYDSNNNELDSTYVKFTNETKNTTGSTNTDSKIYLVGALTQAANPQTYSDSEVYTTNGTLTTNKLQVGGTKATMQYNTTEDCIEFVFA